MKYDNKDIVILLYPFIEKDSKDYEESKVIATKRIQTLYECQ